MQSSDEYRLQPDDPLCFVRISKTASTTLLSVLNAKFDAEQICPILEGEIFNATPAQLAAYRFFGAHFGYDIHVPLGRKPVFFTVLRHPVDRAISFFKHRQSDFSEGEFSQFLRAETAKGLRAFTCSDDPTIRVRTSNLATRQIAVGLGSRHAHPFLPDPRESEFSDQELLSLAKAHLQEFAFVGLTEQFQASLFLMAYTFGWQPVTQYQNRRVNAQSLSRQTLDSETIDAILSVNQLDLHLYEYGQQLFATRWDRMVQALQDRYGTVIPSRSGTQLNEQLNDPTVRQSLIRTLEQHYEHRYAESNPTPQRLICFNSLQAIPGTGWQRRRWIGPGTEATLDFPLATHENLTIRIYINNTAAADILDSFALKVNHELIPLKPLVKRERAALFEGVIPQAVLASSDRPFTRLTLLVNRTAALPNLLQDGTSDKLLVGVAVQQVQIFAAPEFLPQPQKYLLFLYKDPVWVETANFIQRYLQAGERMAGPGEFMERFPQHCLFYAEPFSHIPDLGWVVVHKGWVEKADASALTWTMAQMQPVFANPVFVVFSNRSDVPPLNPDDPNVSACRHWRTASQTSPVQISSINQAVGSLKNLWRQKSL